MGNYLLTSIDVCMLVTSLVYFFSYCSFMCNSDSLGEERCQVSSEHAPATSMDAAASSSMRNPSLTLEIGSSHYKPEQFTLSGAAF
jgi:hypothetical protein